MCNDSECSCTSCRDGEDCKVLAAKDAEIERLKADRDSGEWRQFYMREWDAEIRKVARLRGALEAAASSLETLKKAGGRGYDITHLSDVRGYASSRARVAREALAAIPATSEPCDGSGWLSSTADANGGRAPDDEDFVNLPCIGCPACSPCPQCHGEGEIDTDVAGVAGMRECGDCDGTGRDGGER